MIYFVLLFLFTSCCPSSPGSAERYEEAVRVRGKYTRFAIQEGLEPFGFGQGTSGDIDNLYLAFDKEGQYSLTESRIFMVCQIENFLRIINEDREIRPHLHEFPATNKLIELSIWFKNADKTKMSADFISNILLRNGLIRYGVANGIPLTKTIHLETYEEALEWVKENAPEALIPCEMPIEMQ